MVLIGSDPQAFESFQTAAISRAGLPEALSQNITRLHRKYRKPRELAAASRSRYCGLVARNATLAMAMDEQVEASDESHRGEAVTAALIQSLCGLELLQVNGLSAYNVCYYRQLAS